MFRGAVVCGFLLLGASGALAACGDGGSAGAHVDVEGLDGSLAVEVADDRRERARGLSGREEVPAGTGMLFVYDSAEEREFWMRETLVPLDIAWVLDERVVGVSTMLPCRAADADDCERYPSPGEVDSAVEARAGTFTAVSAGAAVHVRP